jgi:hypothetical protein
LWIMYDVFEIFTKTRVPVCLVLRIWDPVPFRPLDPGSGAFLTPRSGGWVINQDPGSGSGINNPDHISESLETIFWVKIRKFFDADPGSGMEKIRVRDKHPGSATLPVGMAVGPRQRSVGIHATPRSVPLRIRVRACAG